MACISLGPRIDPIGPGSRLLDTLVMTFNHFVMATIAFIKSQNVFSLKGGQKMIDARTAVPTTVIEVSPINDKITKEVD